MFHRSISTDRRQSFEGLLLSGGRVYSCGEGAKGAGDPNRVAARYNPFECRCSATGSEDSDGAVPCSG